MAEETAGRFETTSEVASSVPKSSTSIEAINGSKVTDIPSGAALVISGATTSNPFDATSETGYSGGKSGEKNQSNRSGRFRGKRRTATPCLNRPTNSALGSTAPESTATMTKPVPFGMLPTLQSSLGVNAAPMFKGVNNPAVGSTAPESTATVTKPGFGPPPTLQSSSGVNDSVFGATAVTDSASFFAAATGVPFNLSNENNQAETFWGVEKTRVKFDPTYGIDKTFRNGETQTEKTRLQCITCMKEYEGKSMDELRFDDYLIVFYSQGRAGRSGTTSQVAPLLPKFSSSMEAFNGSKITATTSSTATFTLTATTSNPFAATSEPAFSGGGKNESGRSDQFRFGKTITSVNGTATSFLDRANNPTLWSTAPESTATVTKPVFGMLPTGQTSFDVNNSDGGTLVKFSPTTISDTIFENGVKRSVLGCFYSITFMPYYESKSFEELRLEDYAAFCQRRAKAQNLFTKPISTIEATVVANSASPLTAVPSAPFDLSNTNISSKTVGGFDAAASSPTTFSPAPGTGVGLGTSQNTESSVSLTIPSPTVQTILSPGSTTPTSTSSDSINGGSRFAVKEAKENSTESNEASNFTSCNTVEANCDPLTSGFGTLKQSLADMQTTIAHHLYETEKYRDALAAYTQAIEFCPEVPEYYNNRATCYKILGEHDKALSDAKHCITIDPTFVQAHVTVIKCYLIVGDIHEVKSALSKAMLLDTKDRSILAEQEHIEHLERFAKEAEVAYNKKDYRKVVDCMDRCLEVSPLSRSFVQRKAECLKLLKLLQEELEQKILAKRRAAQKFHDAKRYSEASTIYTQIIELCPENPGYYAARSFCYMNSGKRSQALVDAKKCLNLGPTSVKAYLNVIRCFRWAGDLPGMKSTLSKSLELFPENHDILAEQKHLEDLENFSKQAEVAYAERDFEQVVNYMERCSKISKQCSAFDVRKAECLIFLKKFSEALKTENHILTYDKEAPDTIYVRGMRLYYEGDVAAALFQFRNLFRLVPDYTKALNIYKKAKNLSQRIEDGQVALRMQKYSQALQIYSEALTVDPPNLVLNTTLHVKQAATYFGLKQFMRCIETCTKILALLDGDLKALMYLQTLRDVRPIVLLKRAACHENLKDFEEAVDDYERAFEINGSSDTRRLLDEAKLALNKSRRKDHYKILGLNRNASTDDIKQAYRKKALIHHPDKHVNTSNGEIKRQEQKFKKIGEAYTVLMDPQKRADYNRTLD